MDTKAAVRSLAALAQDSRLEVFRLLVQAGPAGLAAGEIAERLGLPASTLSFHVKALAQAGLVESRQESRFNYYSARFSAVTELIAFLGENCCGGHARLPSTASRR
jgi:DNA-binding transcriptional ArsR family regulator